MRLAVYELVLSLIVRVTACQQFWPSLSEGPQLALRSQRDAMINMSIDQVPTTGIHINSVLLSSENETVAMTNLGNLLRVGVQAYQIDLEFNKSSGNLSISGSNTSFISVLSSIDQYLVASNNFLSANMLVLLLRFPSNVSAHLQRNISLPNITAELEYGLGLSTIYTPAQLNIDRSVGLTQGYDGNRDRSGWPTLDYFLYKLQKRALVAYIDSNISSALPSSFVFGSGILSYETTNATVSCPLNDNHKLTSVARKSWRFLQMRYSAGDIYEYAACGYSPIIDNEYNSSSLSSIAGLLQNSLLWSWAYNEPNTYESVKSNSTALVAKRCAVIHYTSSNSSIYWAVANCYEKMRSVCRHKDNTFDWVVSEDTDNYFSTHEQGAGDVCPENYTLSFPQTPLQQMAVGNYLGSSHSENLDAWIDLNSVSVPDCWVPGGPYASCPYQKDVSARNFVAIITPTSVFSAVTIALVLFLTWRKVPIQDNRKRWKKITASHSKSEKEGVPS
ncbi:LADA_0H19284g1_1 [Lachancea dasiensis]|uniref:Maintenance of telomere capping protein 6 n=1 Tax=Lachancea dasiensis TaxID=1072105 RepID=A0A1G4K682_9SACH|nr:LADA_0H19284g1_1 [Lachancea dasiensis]